MVAKDLQAPLGIFSHIFAEYVRVLGLALNLRRTVLISLSDRTPAEFSRLFERTCPGWNVVQIRL